MRFPLPLLLPVTALLLLCAVRLFPIQKTLASSSRPLFAQIAPAGVMQSWACDINNKGQIVGYSVDRHNRIEGFLFSNSRYTPISGPKGAIKTWVFGINDNGDIIGDYLLSSSEPNPHGFLLRSGRYSEIVGPTWEKGFQQASGINDRGEIVGSYLGRDGHPHGFLLSGDTYRTIEPQGAHSLAVASGINNKGDVAGFYDRAVRSVSHSESHGFLLKGGAYATVDKSEGGDTRITSVNDKSQVLVSWTAANAQGARGFILDHGAFKALNLPVNAQDVQVAGLNDQGDVVGSYTDGKALTHGFLLRRP